MIIIIQFFFIYVETCMINLIMKIIIVVKHHATK
jgi:hypothetical protein